MKSNSDIKLLALGETVYRVFTAGQVQKETDMLKVVAAHSSETSVNFYQTPRRYVPEGTVPITVNTFILAVLTHYPVYKPFY